MLLKSAHKSVRRSFPGESAPRTALPALHSTPFNCAALRRDNHAGSAELRVRAALPGRPMRVCPTKQLRRHQRRGGCVWVRGYPVIQTLLQLRNAAGAPLARAHAHTHLRAHTPTTTTDSTCAARHLSRDPARNLWMPTLTVGTLGTLIILPYQRAPKPHRNSTGRPFRLCGFVLRHDAREASAGGQQAQVPGQPLPC